MGKMGNDVRKFSKSRVKGEADKVTRAFIMGLFGEIVRRTPVLEGRARGSWEVGTELATNTRVDGPKNKAGRVKMPSGFAGTVRKIEQKPVYISSALIYIVPLEHGHSKIQAPHGMVQQSIAHTVAQFRSGG